jgi:hypothetical protein
MSIPPDSSDTRTAGQIELLALQAETVARLLRSTAVAIHAGSPVTPEALSLVRARVSQLGGGLDTVTTAIGGTSVSAPTSRSSTAA